MRILERGGQSFSTDSSSTVAVGPAGTAFGSALAFVGPADSHRADPTYEYAVWVESRRGQGYLLVGAPGRDAFPGAAFLYRRMAGSGEFVLEKQLSVPLNDSDRFGTTVALGDDIAYVGATGDDGSPSGTLNAHDRASADSGAIYTFAHGVDGSWGVRNYLKPFDSVAGTTFGSSLRVSGAGFAVAAPRDSLERRRDRSPSEWCLVCVSVRHEQTVLR